MINVYSYVIFPLEGFGTEINCNISDLEHNGFVLSNTFTVIAPNGFRVRFTHTFRTDDDRDQAQIWHFTSDGENPFALHIHNR